jgi:hypothetical protein
MRMESLHDIRAKDEVNVVAEQPEQQRSAHRKASERNAADTEQAECKAEEVVGSDTQHLIRACSARVSRCTAR